VTNWTGQAHLLADGIREPGFAAAALNAAAWAAGVNPEATAGLIGAATALTSGDCGPQLWAQADPVPSDQELLAAAAELEGAVAQLLKLASQMARDCRAGLEAAYARAAAAAAAIAAAQAQLAAASTSRQAAAAQSALAAAESALSGAQAVIADCEAALEVIAGCGGRLEHAANCLRRVPEDLAGTYEVPYQFVHEGGDLPYAGDFLTSGITWEAACPHR
jgi:hypothetical protein